MKDMLAQIKTAFINNGGENIYTAFDALPVRDKGKFFTVLSIGEYETLTPIYTDTTVYMPVKAELAVKVFAPENCSQQALCEYYSTNFERAVDKLCGMSSRLLRLDVTMDKTLGRLMLKAVLKIGGMKSYSRTAVT